MGFTPFPVELTPAGLEEAYRFLSESADCAAFFPNDGFPWLQALETTDLDAYPPLLREYLILNRALQIKYLPSHRMYLAANVIHHVEYDRIAPAWTEAGANQPLPPGWDAYPMDHPDIVRAAANYLRTLIRIFEPEFVALGVEVNLLYCRKPAAWPEFTRLYRTLRDTLRSEFPGVRFGFSIQYENLLGLGSDAFSYVTREGVGSMQPLIEAIDALLPFTDALALSTYPFMIPGLRLPDDFFDPAARLARRHGLPMLIEQTGYTSRSFEAEGIEVPGSPEAQRDFMAFLMARAYEHDFQYVMNWVPRDYGDYYGAGIFARTWAYTGLVDTQGTPRPAWRVWEDFRKLPLVSGA